MEVPLADTQLYGICAGGNLKKMRVQMIEAAPRSLRANLGLLGAMFYPQ